MRVRTFSVLFVVMAIYYIMADAAEVFVDDFVGSTTEVPADTAYRYPAMVSVLD